jgi:hypothetical protein
VRGSWTEIFATLGVFCLLCYGIMIFWLWFDDDDGALSLEGHSLAFVEVYFGM